MKHKSKIYKTFLAVFAGIDLLAMLVFFSLLLKPKIQSATFALLSPKGIIAAQEKSLMLTALMLMLSVVAVVFALYFFVVWKYRANNSQSRYSPESDSQRAFWLIWLIPGSVIFIIAGLIWETTHELDPYRPLNLPVKPLTVQVVALRWKWLFIYPEQRIASVNFLQFPEKTPLNLELTADAPMNSFWIPQLGGQMYAMTGMSTSLHLMAQEAGDYQGSAAEISGQGFAGMRFLARSSAPEDFNGWVSRVKATGASLDWAEYKRLSQPSENEAPRTYALTDVDLYNSIMAQFMAPVPESGAVNVGHY